MRQEEKEKQEGLEGGQGGFGRIHKTLAVHESREDKSVINTWFQRKNPDRCRGSSSFPRIMGKGVGVNFQ